MSEKKRLRQRLENVTEELEGSVKHVTTTLQEITEEYAKKGYSDFYLEYEAGYDYNAHVLYGFRMETDNELVKRLKIEEKAKEKNHITKERKEERDRKEYERLKTKYGS